jgi:hemolysin III
MVQFLQSLLGKGEVGEDVNEEIANTLTHLFGFFCSAALCYFLIVSTIVNKRSWHHKLASFAFGASLIILYACSTIYHFIGVNYNKQQDVLEKWQLLDHVAIYYLIAGSYTPLVLLIMIKRGVAPRVGQFMLFLIWTLAFLGSGSKILFSTEVVSENVGLAFYVGMGWTALIALPYIRNIPAVIVKWLLIGGVSYTMGVYFLIAYHIHFNHMVWHFFVMMGSFAHAIAVLLAVHIDAISPDTQHDLHLTKTSIYEAATSLFSLKEFNAHKKNR